ncbi:MAG: FecR domain-containing protein, partial [Bacteroidales bacterium]|nr:FecR domain-containing protein [Bacteroidales bacterium]
WTQLATADNVMEYTLPDSTRVVLSPHSTLCYQSEQFKSGQREVRMNGKIYFHVHRDEAHPFRATGQHAVIKVLGTAFQIDETPADSVTEVYVSSGSVLFAAKGEDSGIVLTKQMQARLLPGKRMPQITEPPTPNPAAWAVGTFVYESTPLAVVLKELSDYYHVKLTATDTDKTLTAEFDTNDDLENIISLIEASLDINIEQK